MKSKYLNFNAETLKNFIKAFIFVLMIALVGSLLTDANSIWYQNLAKPSQFMPRIAFPIVWSSNYILFFVVVFLILQRKQMDICTLVLLLINGILQVLWSGVYFKAHSLLGGLVVIVFVLISAIFLEIKLYKIDKKYFWMLLIYPIWVSLATFLNAATWILN